MAIACDTSHGAYKFSSKPDGDILAMHVIEAIHARQMHQLPDLFGDDVMTSFIVNRTKQEQRIHMQRTDHVDRAQKYAWEVCG